MIRFFSGLIIGVWLAQTYDLPNVSKEFENFKNNILKKNLKNFYIIHTFLYTNFLKYPL